ncbi:MAG: ArsR/SmtB family transcription factor [Gammaproteobacteria bacterium]
MGTRSTARLVDGTPAQQELAEQALLDRVFFALSDPIRRSILDRLGEEALLVSELAAPFAISLQAVSRHIQMLVRAGLVQQARTGRVSRCSIEVAPIFAAAVWINRYSKYWQAQFDTLAGWLDVIERRRAKPRKRPGAKKALL